MAADITDITDGNQPDIASQLHHILTDLHEILPLLHQMADLERVNRDALVRLETELDSWRPLLAQFRSPAAAMFAGRKARKAAQ